MKMMSQKPLFFLYASLSPYSYVLILVLLPQGTSVVYASAGATHDIHTITMPTALMYRILEVCANSG